MNDAFSPCNGTQTSTNVYVKEVYLNASSVFFGDTINATCEFKQLSGVNHYEYIWYNNDSSSNANWINITNWTNSTLGTFNRSVVFVPNSTEGTQIVRCIVSYQNETLWECANNTYSATYDNDDVNFTVTENDTGNITYEVCTNSIQNITVNNSLYFNGYNSSYFYPYANPLNFINSSYNSTYDAKISDNVSWNESYADTKYASIGVGADNASWNQSFADTLYYSINNPFGYINYTTGNTTDEIFSVCNNNTFSTISEPLWSANYSAFNISWSSTYNSSYLTAETDWNGNYSKVWNITGGIPSTNLTINSNLNMSIYNQSYYLSAEAIPACSKYYNSTGVLKWCDCFNATHKWMANTC
jgi:hypothetical protein